MNKQEFLKLLQDIRKGLEVKRDDTNIEQELFLLIDVLSNYINGADGEYVKYSDIVDALNSDDAKKVLSAKQGKVLSNLIYSMTEGSLFYGGTVDGAGVCTLSNGFKDRFGIEELTMTADNAGDYNGAYFVCSADGASGIPGTLEALAGDWVVASEDAWGKMSDVAISAITDSEIDSLD